MAAATAVLSAATLSSPNDLQFYIISDATSLKSLADLKHVGGIADTIDTDETQRTIENINQIINKRAKKLETT